MGSHFSIRKALRTEAYQREHHCPERNDVSGFTLIPSSIHEALTTNVDEQNESLVHSLNKLLVDNSVSHYNRFHQYESNRSARNSQYSETSLTDDEKNEFKSNTSSSSVLFNPCDEASSTYVQENSTDNPNCQSTCSELGKKYPCDSASDGDDYDSEQFGNEMIEKIIPESEKNIKIIILHVAEDKNTANDLAENFRKKFGCRAASIDTLETLYRMLSTECWRLAQTWADILIVIISEAWIKAIKNVKPTSDIELQKARYHYKLIEAKYLQGSCINYNLISVIEPGIDLVSYPGLENSYTLQYIRENFDAIEEFQMIANRGKKLIEKSSKKCFSLQNPD